MIHPNTALRFINPEVGFGVVATQLIPEGTITWAQDDLDRVFEPEEVRALPSLFQKPLDHFAFRDNLGRYILCWDHGRYVNHSSRANCITTAYGFEIAVRDIELGHELTDDYGFLNLDRPFEAFPEKGTKRTTILPDDLIRYHSKWDRKLKKAFQQFSEVDQPLSELLPNDLLSKAFAIARGEEEMDSVLACYYPGATSESVLQ